MRHELLAPITIGEHFLVLACIGTRTANMRLTNGTCPARPEGRLEVWKIVCPKVADDPRYYGVRYFGIDDRHEVLGLLALKDIRNWFK